MRAPGVGLWGVWAGSCRLSAVIEGRWHGNGRGQGRCRQWNFLSVRAARVGLVLFFATSVLRWWFGPGSCGVDSKLLLSSVRMQAQAVNSICRSALND